MNTFMRIGLTAISLSLSAVVSTGSAHACGCIAVSEEGTCGYSYNFDNGDDATASALNECAARTTTDASCEITECIEGS